MIKEDLQVEGHEIRQIFNVLHRKTSEKLLLYFLDLEPKPNRRDIFNIKYINQVYQPTKLQLKHPTRKRQYYSAKGIKDLDTKNQRFRSFRCIKCGCCLTSTCLKTPEIEAFCTNCQGKYPASYKGRIKYKQNKEKKLKFKPTSLQPKHTQNEAHHIRRFLNRGF